MLPDPLPGWKVSATDETIVWEGGSVPADRPATFTASVRLPGMAGDIVHLPTVQRCVIGQRSWTEPVMDPAAPDAAPRLELVVSHQPRRATPTTAQDATTQTMIPGSVTAPPPVTTSHTPQGPSRTLVGGTTLGAAMLTALALALLTVRRHRQGGTP